MFKTPMAVLFSIEKYRNSLIKVCQQRNIQVDLQRNLIEIDPAKKEATFGFLTEDTEAPRKTETLKVIF